MDVLTFGCRLNIVESESMRAAAAAAGERDLLIVNSCGVTAEATRQAVRAIRRAKREAPHRRIAVTGCGVEIEPARFAIPEVDRILRNADKSSPGVWRALAPDDPIPPPDRPRPIHTRAFVDIQNGCDHRCTFCVIPLGRGASRSRPIEEVVARIARLVDEGVKEVVLTGVDLTSWGGELPGAPALGRLVREILARIPALPRLRLSSLDCAEADAELRQALAEEASLMPHLHLSLQSGCDLILKRMKRRHLRADAIRFCAEMRRLRPQLALGADLIVGFPTETEAMFEETMSLVDACRLSFLHVFPYSARPGTPAARMPQVAPPLVRERAARLRKKGEEARARRLADQIGRTVRVLAEMGERGHAEDFSLVRTPPGAQRGAILDLVVTESTGRELIGAFLPSHRRANAPSYASEAAP